jgi:hypothetical protein
MSTKYTQPPIRFTENETGEEVLVTGHFVWGNENARLHAVEYPTGRTYIVTEPQLNLHFTIVSPQEVFLAAYGVTDRPLAAQRAREHDLSNHA